MIAFTEKTNLAPEDTIMVRAKDQEGRQVTIELYCKSIKIGDLPCDGYVTILAGEKLNA